MSIGIVILAHTHLHRTRQLAAALSGWGFRVAIHVDADAPAVEFGKLAEDLRNHDNVVFAERHACDWGRFSLVRAGLGAARALVDAWPDTSHLIQISGSCLPVQPAEELRNFLRDHPETDFVESVPATQPWVQGGLGHERFLYHFPFSWKRQRWAFDAAVEVQRALRYRRTIPEGIVPHLGSQWWCLTRRTFEAIMADPRRPAFDRYFKGTWIPDESYVPTLVRRHARNLVSRSLTLARFDDQGKPHVFYDDHGDLLSQTDHFFARKIWHGADKLYRRFLHLQTADRVIHGRARSIETDLGLDRVFIEARTRRCLGRPGLRNAGRFPASRHEPQPRTARPYHVFVGFGQVFDGFHHWLGNTTGLRAHGRVFQSDRVAFSRDWRVPPAGIVPNAAIRDMNPEQYLCNMIWADRDATASLMFELADGDRMAAFFARDPNATITMVQGSWILDLFQRGLEDQRVLRNQARRLSGEARTFEREIAAAGDAANLRVVPLSSLMQRSGDALKDIQADLSAPLSLRPRVLPPVRDLSGLGTFLDRLRLMGIDTGEFGDTAPVRRVGRLLRARAR